MQQTNKKLWQAASTPALHPLVETYTAGDDYQLDQELLGYDIRASIAHAEMLAHIGVLTKDELYDLTTALHELLAAWQAGAFTVQKNHEDGHTAIEHYLVEKVGSAGKKIHTGRSRNDQALVMMRLYLKDKMMCISTAMTALVEVFQAAAMKTGDTPMPGYTHTQKAMPTTVAAWLQAYADGFVDAGKLLSSTLAIIDQNPLGSAAGFGVTMPLDREFTTKKLGFAKTQENPLYCGLSRGMFELLAVQALAMPMLLAGKFAQDMILFTTQEFDFFSLPKSFTTGSSIMPHKANYDLFEIVRAQAHSFPLLTAELQSVVGGVGSGYHRDLQLTKGTTMRAFTVAHTTIEVLTAAVSNLKVNTATLQAAITPEMLSVTKIEELVAQGVPFRDAYLQVKLSLQ